MNFITYRAVLKITLDLQTNEHASNSSHRHRKRIDFSHQEQPPSHMSERSEHVDLRICWLLRMLSLSLEKAMAPHSSTLAWKIPWMEEPGGLQSKGSQRVGHDWATSLSLFTFMHWRKTWQSAPVFLPGESQGQGKPGGLPSLGSHRVGHDWSDLAAAAISLSQTCSMPYAKIAKYEVYSSSHEQEWLMSRQWEGKGQKY